MAPSHPGTMSVGDDSDLNIIIKVYNVLSNFCLKIR